MKHLKLLSNIEIIKVILSVFLLPSSLFISQGQTGKILGTVKLDDVLQEYATITISTNPIIGEISDDKGYFEIGELPYGDYQVTASFVGYKPQVQLITISEEQSTVELHFDVNESMNQLDELVVTGTKTFKRQTNSPIIVNVITNETLNAVQACNLSEGLKFQPGLRVETDCQTCNYTQLRMNGLAGGYTQILINGRPVFSPLTGLYGLEQLPTNMIERIEVVRGGGSSLYGSSAIGGTVNVITKVPQKNTYELNSFYQSINFKSNDVSFNGNASLVSKNKSSGVSFFFNHRQRDLYDHNGDNFSEIPEIENTSLGTNVFFLPKENQKLEISVSNLNEFRYGGEMVVKPAYLTQQSEERKHKVWMGSADYQINFNNDKASLITYMAWQNTKRNHYTGVFPDDSLAIQTHIENPPYGTSNASTIQGGLQLNYKVNKFLKGSNTFTLGSEYIYDDVFDEISAYNYVVDQKTKNFGLFLQSDWEVLPSLTLLTGVRMDVHNLVGRAVFNPRVSLLYKYRTNTQFRVSYGTGFRAPQAFDADLHIAFAGGGISRVSLSPDLEPEKSQSISTSINYDRPTDRFIVGFTLEGFYTRLKNAFVLHPVGHDGFGELFEKRNDQGATVKGVTLELRANFDKKVQLETGFTLQSSKFDEAIEYIEGLDGLRKFVRTPSSYGFAVLSITPNEHINVNLNYVYTGKMEIPHFAGAPNQLSDELFTSNSYSDLSIKIGYTVRIKKMKSSIEFYGGLKNIFNAYQNEFDIEKNRDSNFVFGPAQPRTILAGIKIKSLE